MRVLRECKGGNFVYIMAFIVIVYYSRGMGRQPTLIPSSSFHLIVLVHRDLCVFNYTIWCDMVSLIIFEITGGFGQELEF